MYVVYLVIMSEIYETGDCVLPKFTQNIKSIFLESIVNSLVFEIEHFVRMIASSSMLEICVSLTCKSPTKVIGRVDLFKTIS